MLYRLLFALLLTVLSAPAALAAERSLTLKDKQSLQRVALVIGNSSYPFGPLANPKNDARAVGQKLESLGFRVQTKIDCSRREMHAALRAFEESLHQDTVGLFYFAGHGLQVNGENYLVPVDADIRKEYEVEEYCIKTSSVMRMLEYAGSRLNIVILDACRNNPFKRSFRSSAQGLAKMDAPAGTFIAFATAPGSVAADGAGANGVYTASLLNYLDDPGLTIEQVFKHVRRDVMASTGGDQVPWESSSLVDDFSFAGNGQSRPAAPVVPVPVAAEPARLRAYLADSGYVEIPERFSRAGNGVVVDRHLQRRWRFLDPDELFDWEGAVDKAARFGDWRLPTRAELASLLTRDRRDADWGYIDGAFFPRHPRSLRYWTEEKTWGAAWYVDFSEGKADTMSRTNYCAVLLISR